jgi:hypothetical protein
VVFDAVTDIIIANNLRGCGLYWGVPWESLQLPLLIPSYPSPVPYYLDRFLFPTLPTLPSPLLPPLWSNLWHSSWKYVDDSHQGHEGSAEFLNERWKSRKDI